MFTPEEEAVRLDKNHPLRLRDYLILVLMVMLAWPESDSSVDECITMIDAPQIEENNQ